jgi:hypothetical protein
MGGRGSRRAATQDEAATCCAAPRERRPPKPPSHRRNRHDGDNRHKGNSACCSRGEFAGTNDRAKLGFYSGGEQQTSITERWLLTADDFFPAEAGGRRHRARPDWRIARHQTKHRLTHHNSATIFLTAQHP